MQSDKEVVTVGLRGRGNGTEEIAASGDGAAARVGKGREGGGSSTRHRSLSMLITEANVNHDRPGARQSR